MKRLSITQSRNARGLAVALPMVVLALMVILVLGVFSFEVARTAVAREQLRSATESAALAGAATMAGSTTTDTNETQTNAIAAATDMFERNQVFGIALANPTIGITTPTAGQSQLEFQFLDPDNKNAVVPAGDPRGKLLKVKSAFGLPPFAGKVIGIGDSPLPLNAESSGGVGELDVVLCFDCSLSMRFQTKTTRVRRIWDNDTGKVKYIVTGNIESPLGGMQPQGIQSLNAQMRGSSDNALPGNFPPATAANNNFTDIVCNIDEQPVFSSAEEDGFSFPNIGALVEASRGNLENQDVFEASGASTTLAGVVTPRAGYKAKYFELARRHTHPWGEAQAAAQDFFNLMKKNTKAHFGFVAFSTQVAQDPQQTITAPRVGDGYIAGGIGQFPFPAISLNPAQEQTNFEQVQSAIVGVVPVEGTNIGGSIERAVRMFDNGSSRPNARRAIILFTDGAPTAGLPLSPDPFQNCILAAQQAKQRGVAIFGVGLAAEPGLLQEQAQVLGAITTGAGNGGKFLQVTDTSKLKQAFAAIARNLTQIVQ